MKMVEGTQFRGCRAWRESGFAGKALYIPRITLATKEDERYVLELNNLPCATPCGRVISRKQRCSHAKGTIAGPNERRRLQVRAQIDAVVRYAWKGIMRD